MTPHINAKENAIAKTVLMPGDPKRAKFIAEKYLENYELVSDVRGIPAYTGYYNNKKITIMASGMGNASMGIYSYELYKFYDVETIIRIGSCGAYSPNLNIYDVLLVNSCYSESTYGQVQNGDKENILYSSSEINDKILKTGHNIIVGRVHSCDAFYNNLNIKELYERSRVANVLLTDSKDLERLMSPQISSSILKTIFSWSLANLKGKELIKSLTIFKDTSFL